jgi:hypothetical protein
MKIEKNAQGNVDINAKVLGSIVDDMVSAYHVVKQSNEFIAEELKESALLLALHAIKVDKAELAKLATSKQPLQ